MLRARPVALHPFPKKIAPPIEGGAMRLNMSYRATAW